MKKVILTVIILCCCHYGFTQDLNRLDEINGFRKFKFGSSISSFTNIRISAMKSQMKDVTIYDYTGKDMSEFYGVEISRIHLSFYKNQLYLISVEFGTLDSAYTEDQYEIVQQNLEGNFGNDYHKGTSDNHILNCNIWDGNVVHLESDRVNLGDKYPQYNNIVGYILFVQKNIQQEQQKSEMD